MARIDQRAPPPSLGIAWHIVDFQLGTDRIVETSHVSANLHHPVIGFKSQSCLRRICRDDRGYCLNGNCLEPQLAAPGAYASHDANYAGSTEYNSHCDDGALRLQGPDSHASHPSQLSGLAAIYGRPWSLAVYDTARAAYRLCCCHSLRALSAEVSTVD